MNIFFLFPLMAIIFTSCTNSVSTETSTSVKAEFREIKQETYELTKPTENIAKVLVLFGGFPEKPEDIKREFNILDLAKQNSIAVVYMNYNQKLWLAETEKQKLAQQLQTIFTDHQLPTDDIYIGGFSSGGNVSLLISAYLVANKSFGLVPKGVFLVDSPIDLVALYRSSEKNLMRNFSEVSVQESTWIIETLEKAFGDPHEQLSTYEQYAVYTSVTDNIDNLKNLKDLKIRFYTEPDTTWWKTNRKADYDQMNAFYIKKLSESLKASGFNQLAYIPTKNKGFRANGDRHPHSWSIVDKSQLVQWIMD
ncbi:MAG: hypothetical protein MK212_14185 [Saprospiraceae bacterium]|nr:hypothetical protein [Saprospiraceae bacterium]